MDASHVDHAVVIQPIQYLYDHQYLLNVMQANPECKRRFKYMALFDPTLDDAAFGECLLDGLARQGFVGVRFNPALFPNERMADKDGKGAAWMRKCGALNLVVGIMCFKGLSRHYDDVVALLEAGPDTNVIIDHMGFFVQNGQEDETSFAQVDASIPPRTLSLILPYRSPSPATPASYHSSCRWHGFKTCM
jgi:predicted TIM-barrel fold metal-dependent hydrolase